MPRIRARDVVSRDVVATRGYSTGGAASLLTVGRSTLASRAALGTLGDGATLTLGAAASSGTAGDTMARRSWIAVRRVTASFDVAGTVPSSARSTSHRQDGHDLGGDGWRGAMAGV
jgi:hypothetical protein